MFPYFMLVAFEGGSLIRAFFLFLLYPLICLVNKEVSLRIMVMVSFFGLKKENFRVGSAVLPKFFLEDVGEEGFEILNKGEKKVGVSELPQVMVESFLKDYLDIEFVVGREIKVWCGYFVGVMEKSKKVDEVLGNISPCCKVTGISNSNKPIAQWFSFCKDIYLVNEGEKRNWHPLPKEKYPNPLIFHDGRLAFKPTPLAILAMFIWFPFGLTLSIIRVLTAITLPYDISIPILAFTGIQLKLSNPKNQNKTKNLLYVCNHKTLLDPLFISFGLKKPFAAVTYSLSRVSELLSPIRTMRLTRNRDQDAKMMAEYLSQGDLVVCPEGTTCREPYLLRFSPLFSELSDDIVPVGMEAKVTMFYGTTAGGLKCLDPFFFFMNPWPSYTAQFLQKVLKDGAKTKYEMANYVQSEIGKALGYECTRLTRKDKYLILAGNEGRS